MDVGGPEYGSLCVLMTGWFVLIALHAYAMKSLSEQLETDVIMPSARGMRKTDASLILTIRFYSHRGHTGTRRVGLTTLSAQVAGIIRSNRRGTSQVNILTALLLGGVLLSARSMCAPGWTDLS